MHDWPTESKAKITTKAVILHSRIVSVNTSNMPQHPCAAGCFVSASACAMGAVPQPASFENSPRVIPYLMLLHNIKPPIPPTDASGVNASAKIRCIASGMRELLIMIMYNDAAM